MRARIVAVRSPVIANLLLMLMLVAAIDATVAVVVIADTDATFFLPLRLFFSLPCTGEVVAVVCESMRPCGGGDTMSSTWPPSLTLSRPLLPASPTSPPFDWRNISSRARPLHT